MGIDTSSDRGAVSTEMAIVIAGMVAVAIAATAIFLSKAESNANKIPGRSFRHSTGSLCTIS